MDNKITINTGFADIDSFKASFLSGIKRTSSFTKRTSLVFSLDWFFDKDYYCGNIDQNMLWIMRPRRICLPLYQRIFLGTVCKTENSVIIQGRFSFPSFALFWNISFGGVAAVLLFLVLMNAPFFSQTAMAVVSLLLGAAFTGISIGIELLSSVCCEKDVLMYLKRADGQE